MNPAQLTRRRAEGVRVRASWLRRLAPLSLAAVDVVLIYVAFAVAYWFRYVLQVGPRISDHVTFSAYQPLAALVLGVMVPLMYAKGAYRFRLERGAIDELGLLFSASTITVAAMVVFAYMLHALQYSRAVTIYLWVLLVVVLALGRSGYRSLQAFLYRSGLGARRLVVVGATDAGKMIMQSVVARRELGYHLAGFVDHGPVPARDFGRFRSLGSVDDLMGMIEAGAVDEVIVALPASAHEQVWPLLGLCERKSVGVKLVPDLFEMSLGRVEIDSLAGIPVLGMREQPLRPVALAVKRVLDVIVSLVLLAVSLPFLALLAFLIKFESPGPALLRQERVGKDGKPFLCLKLRTMLPGADELRPTLLPFNEAAGPHFKIRDDPRMTRLGRHMRRWSLDEIPQLWNVVQGEMSLVGPRPPLPSEVALYESAHMRRLEIQPGLTGLWQVSGRSDLPFDEMVVMDVYYIDNWSLSLDLKILLRTVRAVLARRGAY